jgi:plastocyanin
VIAAAPPPVPVGIGLREYRISVYRPAVRVGRVVFNMTNFGEDAHDLQVRGPHGYRSRTSADVPASARLAFRVTFTRPGTYRLLCVKPGHVKLGMRATLRVSR